MRKSLTKVISTVLLTGIIGVASAYATPSTHIWAPSTDVQPYKVVHLTHDVYAPVSNENAATGTRIAPAINLGLTVGVLPFEKINAEAGFDIIQSAVAGDANPMYFNFKIGTPEDKLLKGVPAIALGSYLIGTKSEGPARTDSNIIYGKVAKTFGQIGKVSAGYYTGNDKVLSIIDDSGSETKNDGVMLCWEKTVSEISDKLWVAVDYMGGDNSLGTVNVGFAWAFTPNVSVIFGYDMLNNQDLPGFADTFTTQLDINF